MHTYVDCNASRAVLHGQNAIMHEGCIAFAGSLHSGSSGDFGSSSGEHGGGGGGGAAAALLQRRCCSSCCAWPLARAPHAAQPHHR